MGPGAGGCRGEQEGCGARPPPRHPGDPVASLKFQGPLPMHKGEPEPSLSGGSVGAAPLATPKPPPCPSPTAPLAHRGPPGLGPPQAHSAVQILRLSTPPTMRHHL